MYLLRELDMRTCFQRVNRRTRVSVVKKLRPIVASHRVLDKRAKNFLWFLLWLANITDSRYRYALEFLVDRDVVTEDQLDVIVTECASNPK